MRPFLAPRATGRPALPAGRLFGVPRKCSALPGAKAGLRAGLTPPAAGCFALGARPYLFVLSSRLALASFAGDGPETRGHSRA